MDESLLPNICLFLSQIDPFDALPDAVRAELAAQIDISYWVQGETLPATLLVGQGLYLVRSGAVEQRHPDRTLRARLGSGDLFGFSQLEREGDSAYSVTALENTLLYRIPKAVLYQVMTDNPALQHHFATAEHQRLAGGQTRTSLTDDDLLYLKPVAEMVNRDMAVVTPHTSISAAAREMVRCHRSSALVMDNERLLGIITDRDLTKRVVAEGRDLNGPVAEVMTVSPCTIDAREPLLRAVELMMQHNVRSLPVVEQGKVCGVLTATSLVSKSRVQAVFLISRIYRQESVTALRALGVQRQAIFEALVENGAHVRTIQQMMTLIADAFNKRLLQLAERELGAPPCDYAWMVAGSQARQEMHPLSDQDNAIITGQPVSGEEKEYFRRLAEWVCYALAECGYPLCPGHMMASNPQWCTDIRTWEGYYQHWVREPEAEALLNVSVFLDLRALYGSTALVERLQRYLYAETAANRRFIAVLVANSLRITPPLGMFRQFVLARDGENRSVLHIKKQAVNLIVELARIYALAGDCRATDTDSRLSGAVQAGIISEGSRRELCEAFYFINQVRFTHQRQAMLQGRRPANSVSPEDLTQFERNHLKDAFRIIARTQEAAMQRFHAQGILR